MARLSDIEYERQARELVEEFLQRGFLSPEGTQRVERLYAENRVDEALDVIIAERSRDSPGSDGKRVDRPRLL